MFVGALELFQQEYCIGINMGRWFIDILEKERL
jgi:hypothetical protein